MVLILSYPLGFQKNLALWNEIERLENQKEKARNAPGKIRVMEKQLKGLNTKINRFSVHDSMGQEKVLSIVSTLCQKYNVKLNKFPKLVSSKKGVYPINIQKFVLKGRFKPMVRFLRHLEQKAQIGLVASARFYKEKAHYGDHKKDLYLNIYLQNIKTQWDESS